ncbi:transcriptional regulator FtsR [Helcobacillus massiliensis]|uniref:transcriptional regulator FtsR n=1 Tax=Helcobacillus massiliensis TaxID=521392 RepID=UPI002556CC71|nr:MerR family transcriptional regulator [Helcobacillus massiliensis]MDK7741098.1 MerR family transcriptional regulator [Helcobacillus massiliensis]WOO93907.1 MerR family transcriptional regulator [Helcobacillus massiliensis]
MSAAHKHRASALVSIGQVRAQLREEFPDLTHSKLHFLEAEGLIEPVRTASGYRKYSAADVDRILLVLRAQRDLFWPLKVIKEHLDELDRDGSPVRSLSVRALSEGERRPAVRLSRRELAREARVSAAFVTEMEEYGFLVKDAPVYDQQDLDAVTACRDLAEHGLQPRHLSLVRSSAQRQAHLIQSVLTPSSHRDDSVAEGEAEDARASMSASLTSLHTALLTSALNRSH